MKTIPIKETGFGAVNRTHVRRRLAIWLCAGLILAGWTRVSSQTFAVLHTFPSSSPPGGYARLLCSGGALYGLGNGIFRINADGSGYTILKSFSATVYNGSSAYTNGDGATPIGGVILQGDTLYGVASAGGPYGLGTLFSLNTNGSGFTVLKPFSGTPDGKAPYAELLVVSNILYGTTAAGGDFGKGTVFQIGTDGSGFSILKSFNGTNGLLPLGGLTMSDEVLYGTTLSGGASNQGTVFSINPDGSDFATLKEFSGPDGANPRFNLVVSGGWIYGTTEGGGSGGGVVYRLSTDGTEFSVLKKFPPVDPVSGTNDDGNFVQSGLAMCGGALFGSTRSGGYYGSGVLFAIRMDGSAYTVLRHFTATANNGESFVNSDGVEPGPLTLYGGTLYGAAEKGGSDGAGTLFGLNIAPRIDLSGDGSGMEPGGFGFSIVGYSNQLVSVEFSTELAPTLWEPLITNAIGAGPVHFVDMGATNYLRRFYRLEAR